MSETTLAPRKWEDEAGAGAGRRAAILSAAERCIVRNGFHRSTMQDVAAEAGMSAGNVYRYFPSKDAIVEALVARESTALADDFEGLSPDDPMGSFAALARRQVLEAGRDKAVLWLEICAEATRNPAIAAVTAAYEGTVLHHLTALFEGVLAARPPSDRRPDPFGVARLVMTVMGGLMTRQACAPAGLALDGEVADALAIVAAALDGGLLPPSSDETRR